MQAWQAIRTSPRIVLVFAILVGVPAAVQIGLQATSYRANMAGFLALDAIYRAPNSTLPVAAALGGDGTTTGVIAAVTNSISVRRKYREPPGRRFLTACPLLFLFAKTTQCRAPTPR